MSCIYITKERIFTFNIVLIKLVALLHRTEASILPDGPGSVGVHGRIGPSSERKHSRQFICAPSRVCLRVHGLDVETLRGVPDEIFWVFALQLFLSQAGPFWMQFNSVLTGYRSVKKTATRSC